MIINGREFTFQVASDIERNGIGVELNELKDGKDFFVAEIFRNDSKKEVQFTSMEAELPYNVILKLQRVFEAEIPKDYQE
jgi:hypothetical protein